MRTWALLIGLVVACGGDPTGPSSAERFCVVPESVNYRMSVKVPSVPDSLVWTFTGGSGTSTVCVNFTPAARAADTGSFTMDGELRGTFVRSGGGLPDTTFTEKFNFPTRGKFEIDPDDLLYFYDVDRAQWLEFSAVSTRPTSNGGFGTLYFNGGESWIEQLTFTWDRP